MSDKSAETKNSVAQREHQVTIHVACSRLSVVMGERMTRAGERGKNEAGRRRFFIAWPHFLLSPSTIREPGTGYYTRNLGVVFVSEGGDYSREYPAVF